MPQHPKRVVQLMEQYPFLAIVRNECASIDEAYAAVEKVEIKVQRADSNLMFRQADNVRGRVPGRGAEYILDNANKLQGTRLEYYYPVSKDGQVGERRTWDEWPGRYVRDLFNRVIHDWAPSDAVRGDEAFDVVGSIVWVEREFWYNQDESIDPGIKGDDNPVRVDLTLTLFQEPAEGWENLYIEADPQVNIVLVGSRLWKSPEITDSFRDVIYDRLSRLAMEFEIRVYRQGLGDVINRSRKKGMGGYFGNIKVLSYIIAGRMMIQIERGKDQLTFIGFEGDNPRLGFSSIVATLPTAIEMTHSAIKHWEETPPDARGTLLADDTKVSMGF